jgi:hypothetical protein
MWGAERNQLVLCGKRRKASDVQNLRRALRTTDLRPAISLPFAGITFSYHSWQVNFYLRNWEGRMGPRPSTPTIFQRLVAFA